MKTEIELPLSGINAETPWLATIPVLASIYSDAQKTMGAIRMDVFRASDRINSKGETLPGNGLAAHNAVVRRGRRVLVDVRAYGNWLAGRAPSKP